MLGCKGLMFRHLRMMHSVVIVWPMGLYWYCVPYLKKLFPGLWRGKDFFGQNIVNSGLTGELPVGKVCQMIDQQRFDLTFNYSTQHGSQGLAVCHSNMTRRGNGLGTTMRYSRGIFLMANRLPPDIRSFRSFSFMACAFSRTPTCKLVERWDSFWCPIHVDI